MKKIISLAVLVVLLLTMLPVAYAVGDPPKQVSEYTWEAVKQVLYDYEYEGFTSKKPEVGLRFWVPNDLYPFEITDEGKEDGVLGFYVNYDGSFTLEVDLVNMNMNQDEFMEYLKSNGMKAIKNIEVNGRPFILYRDPKVKGIRCNVAATVLEDNSIVEFVFFGDQEKYSLFTSLVIASIRPIDQR